MIINNILLDHSLLCFLINAFIKPPLLRLFGNPQLAFDQKTSNSFCYKQKNSNSFCCKQKTSNSFCYKQKTSRNFSANFGQSDVCHEINYHFTVVEMKSPS